MQMEDGVSLKVKRLGELKAGDWFSFEADEHNDKCIAITSAHLCCALDCACLTPEHGEEMYCLEVCELEFLLDVTNHWHGFQLDAVTIHQPTKQAVLPTKDALAKLPQGARIVVTNSAEFGGVYTIYNAADLFGEEAGVQVLTHEDMLVQLPYRLIDESDVIVSRLRKNFS